MDSATDIDDQQTHVNAQRQVPVAFASLVLIWSTTPLAVVLSLRELHPVWALTLRFVLASVIVAMGLRWLKIPVPSLREGGRAYAAGFISMFGAMYFTYLGAATVPSGMVAVLYGMSPLLIGLLTQLLPGEARLSLAQWLGLLAGLFGLVLMTGVGGVSAAGSHGMAREELHGIVLVLLGVGCYVLSVLWLKRQQTTVPPLAQAAVAIWLSALASLCLLPFYSDAAPQQMPGLVSWLALLYSAGVASVLAMLCYFFLVRQVSAHTVSLTTLLTPVIAVLLGMVLNHEQFRASAATGMAVIFAGLLLYYGRELLQLLRNWKWRGLSRQVSAARLWC